MAKPTRGPDEPCIFCPGMARWDPARGRHVCNECDRPWTECTCGIPREAIA